MIILGIDPGTASTGYGVVEASRGRFRVIDYGCITTSTSQSLSKRLQKIYEEVKNLIGEYQPDEFVIEQLFFNTNAKTALAVGQARGVAILAAADSDLDANEYTPLQVKQAVAGYGRATKQQIQYMIRTLFNLGQDPKPDDAADALALTVCHAHSYKLARSYKQEIEDRKR